MKQDESGGKLVSGLIRLLGEVDCYGIAPFSTDS